jgi:hypothetical protein
VGKAETPMFVSIRKIISRQIRRNDDGINVAADVNAVFAANVDEGSPSTSKVSRHTKTRVVQRGGKTVVSETKVDDDRGDEG